MNEHVAPALPADGPLYRTEEEIAAAVGVGDDKWRGAVKTLEQQGLPKRDPLFCNRRYWPAVRAFLDRRHGLSTDFPFPQPDGKEKW